MDDECRGDRGELRKLSFNKLLLIFLVWTLSTELNRFLLVSLSDTDETLESDWHRFSPLVAVDIADRSTSLLMLLED
jgi:hypothetical protein